MKKVLICTLVMIVFQWSFGQDNPSNKSIDSLIGKIEYSKKWRTITSINQLKAWDIDIGNHLDTAIWIYAIELNTGTLLKATYIEGSSNINIVFYYHLDSIIAARLVSSYDFPSWSNTLHYYNEGEKLSRDEIIIRDIDSNTIDDLRKFLLYQGNSALDYFNSTFRTKNK